MNTDKTRMRKNVSAFHPGKSVFIRGQNSV